MEDNGLKFDTDEHVQKFKAPIMILHAEDDRVVPYKLGVKVSVLEFAVMFFRPISHTLFFFFCSSITRQRRRVAKMLVLSCSRPSRQSWVMAINTFAETLVYLILSGTYVRNSRFCFALNEH